MVNKVNVFFLPFAGGSKYSYNIFQQMAPSQLQIMPIELPGRGSRIKEKLLTNIHEMVADTFNQIRDKLNQPYIIYGHSMGTLLGYLLTLKILEKGCNKPLFLFFTGTAGPDPRIEKQRYSLPKDEFIDMLKEYGGSPDEILNNQSLFDFFEPILRADFQAMETYIPAAATPFSIPIYVTIGNEEKLTEEEALTWQQVTTHKVTVEKLSGRHFFILEHTGKILEMINQQLNNINSYERKASISQA